MRIPKCPNLDCATFETSLSRKVCGKGAYDQNCDILGIHSTRIHRWTPMGENHDIAVWRRALELSDSSIKPIEIALMYRVMRIDVPIIDLEEVVGSETDSIMTSRRDGGKETAVEDSGVGVRESICGAVEEDEVS
ncbi:hypothetical protein ACMFMF_000780 [Clarireedia jacksonii]